MSLRKFLPILCINTLGVFNDTLLRSSVLILIAYHLKHTVTLYMLKIYADLAVLLFNLPYFLLSSYAGKVADFYDKVKIIRFAKISEIIIISMATVGFVFGYELIILTSLFLLGIHSTFLSPIKFSILPEFVHPRSVKQGVAYIESGIFVGIFVAQVLSSFIFTQKNIWLLVYILYINGIIGLVLSFILQSANRINKLKIKLNFNPIKDSYHVYKMLSISREIKLNLYAISWFWSFSALFMAQLALFSKNHLNASIGAYGALLTMLFCGICLGSVYSGYSRLKIPTLMTLSVYLLHISLLLLFAFNYETTKELFSIRQYITNPYTLLNLIVMLTSGIGLGIYSTICYNQLLAKSPQNTLSQMIASVNQLSGITIFIVLGIASALFYVMGQWWVLLLISIINLIFNCYYLYHYQKIIRIH